MAIVALLLAACFITLLSNHYSRNRERGEYERELAAINARNNELDAAIKTANTIIKSYEDRAKRINELAGDTDAIIRELGSELAINGTTIRELRENQERINERASAIIADYIRLRELFDGFTDSGQ